MLLVHDNRNALAIVFDRQATLIALDLDLDVRLRVIAHLVIGCVDHDLIEALVKARHVCKLAHLHALRLSVEHVHLGGDRFDGADVRVRALQDVLVLRQLLIRVLNGRVARGRFGRRRRSRDCRRID